MQIMVVQMTTNCGSCPGANASDYFLAAQTSAGVQPGTGRQLLSSLQGMKSGDILSATFTMHMPQDVSALNSDFPIMCNGTFLCLTYT